MSEKLKKAITKDFVAEAIVLVVLYLMMVFTGAPQEYSLTICIATGIGYGFGYKRALRTLRENL